MRSPGYSPRAIMTGEERAGRPSRAPAESGREDVGTAFSADAPKSLPSPVRAPGHRRRLGRARDLLGWAAIVGIVLFVGVGRLPRVQPRAGRGAVVLGVRRRSDRDHRGLRPPPRASRWGPRGLVQPAWGDATRGLLSAAVSPRGVGCLPSTSSPRPAHRARAGSRGSIFSWATRDGFTRTRRSWRWSCSSPRPRRRSSGVGL